MKTFMRFTAYMGALILGGCLCAILTCGLDKLTAALGISMWWAVVVLILGYAAFLTHQHRH